MSIPVNASWTKYTISTIKLYGSFCEHIINWHKWVYIFFLAIKSQFWLYDFSALSLFQASMVYSYYIFSESRYQSTAVSALVLKESLIHLNCLHLIIANLCLLNILLKVSSGFICGVVRYLCSSLKFSLTIYFPKQ